MQRRVTWESISERDWNPAVRRRMGLRGQRLAIVRVRPGTARYRSVLRLRYQGFVESGFVDQRVSDESVMQLPRDPDSIIIGMFRGEKILATVTLNTITERFPGMAMELEKNVRLRHAHFRSPHVMEITKLVVAPDVRGKRFVLALLYVSTLVARLLDKRHLWQVSRDVPSDISWRVGLGFDYSVGEPFIDGSLNGMASRIGYLYLPEAPSNPRVPRFIRGMYAEVLSQGLAEHRA
jgi:hypothetical protein